MKVKLVPLRTAARKTRLRRVILLYIVRVESTR
jgi:hypothetical protein